MEILERYDLMNNLFSNIFFSFAQSWDYKPSKAVHADSPGVYTSDKIINLSTKNKIHLKCAAIDGSVVNWKRGPIPFSFSLNKPAGYKVFSESETIHYERIDKSVLNTRSFHLQDDNFEKVDFNQETRTFTLQLIKIWTFRGAIKNLKVIVFGEDIDLLQKTFMVI